MKAAVSWKLYVLLGVGLIFGTLVGTAIYLSGRPTTPSNQVNSPEQGKAIPVFTVEDLDGNPVDINTYQGHPVLINFWATWCVPCQAEMPLLESYAEKYPDLIIIGINDNESPTTIRRFLEKNPVQFKIALDENGKVGNQFQVIGLPTTFFVDAEGILQTTYMGQLDDDLLAALLPEIGITP